MLGWSPLWESIIESSIWREPDHVLRLWVFFLARKNRDGFVPYRSPVVMADITKISDVGKYEEALERLLAPDPNSTTSACGGRRIVAVEGGWRIVNHELYRDKINKEYRREYQRQKQAEYRAKKKHYGTPSGVKRGKPLPGEQAYVNAARAGASEGVLDGLAAPVGGDQKAVLEGDHGVSSKPALAEGVVTAGGNGAVAGCGGVLTGGEGQDSGGGVKDAPMGQGEGLAVGQVEAPKAVEAVPVVESPALPAGGEVVPVASVEPEPAGGGEDGDSDAWMKE